MIQSKKDLLDYLIADKIALKRQKKKPGITDLIWKYEIVLRKSEYYENCSKTMFGRIVGKFYQYKKFKLGIKCCFSIPNNVVDKGLAIVHIGPIVISRNARIGKNFRVHVGVNIGADARNANAAPQIGDNVYVAPGAKLFGDIKIADNIAIGANAVVNKDFLVSNVSIGGIPAKVISDKGSEGIM